MADQQNDLHGRPTASELLQAVHDFLASDVISGTEGRLRFHARVAANAVAIAARELALGEAQAAAHREAMARLGVASERELAEAIRSGALDARIDEVVDVVRETVRARLAVANPGYDAT